MINKTIEQQEAMTASEVILKHSLGWNVTKKDVCVDGKVESDYKAIARADTGHVFQIAKNRYEPIQNIDVFTFFDKITQTGQAKYVDAGSYKGGAVVWLRAKLPYDFEALPGDELKTYLKIVTSHDGSHKLMIYPEVYRQVCSNGMHAFVKDHTKTVGVKHTENAENRFIFNAERVLASEIEYFKNFAEHCKDLARKQMTSLEMDSFLDELFSVNQEQTTATKTKNQIEKIKELVEVGTGMDIAGVKGTRWGIYNAVTEFVDRYRPTRGDKENREYSASFGSGKQLREKAFALLVR